MSETISSVNTISNPCQRALIADTSEIGKVSLIRTALVVHLEDFSNRRPIESR